MIAPLRCLELTPTQERVARLVALGRTDKRIAADLGMRYNTVRVHIVALAFRLRIPAGTNTRVMIARWWWTLHPNEQEGAA